MYTIFACIHLADNHQSTGHVRHYRGANQLPTPHDLKIAKVDDSVGFYLLYFDEHGNEQTDTYHETLDAALEQAEYEFGVLPNEWQFSDISNR